MKSLRKLASVLVALSFLFSQVVVADQSTLYSPNTGTISGLTLTNNYNNAINALATCNSGATAPANTLSSAAVEGQCWIDTSLTRHKLKLYDGAQWLTIAVYDTSAHTWMPVVGGGSASIASATTTDLGSLAETYLTISGTSTIASFGSSATVGSVKFLKFASSGLTITYNATSLIIPGAISHTTASVGETAIVVSLGSGNWQVLTFSTASTAGALLTANTFTGVQTFSAATAFNNAMNFNEASLTVTAGVTAWDMTTQGPDVNISWSSANNLTISNQTASPSGPARGTIRIANSTGATRTITWGTNYAGLTGTLPASITSGQQLVLRYWTQGSSVYVVGADTLTAPTVSFITPHTTVRTSGTSFTTNVATKWMKVTVIGGGATGGTGSCFSSCTIPTSGGGGGGGGVSIKSYLSISGSTSYTYAVGAAGAASTFTDGTTLITGNAGSNGGNASGSVNGSPGAGGTASGGDNNITGFSGNSANGATIVYGTYIVAPGQFFGAGGQAGTGSSVGGSAGTAGAVTFEEWY